MDRDGKCGIFLVFLISAVVAFAINTWQINRQTALLKDVIHKEVYQALQIREYCEDTLRQIRH
jgi:hypothetical protein